MNMDAINTLQAIELEGRTATPAEQEILSRYVGWGGLADAFDPDKPDWANEFLELQAALTPEEYNSRNSFAQSGLSGSKASARPPQPT